MPSQPAAPRSLEFLLTCSKTSLGELILERGNRTANLRKKIRQIEDEIREADAEALLACWIRDNRADLLRMCPIQKQFDFVEVTGAQPLSVSGLPQRLARDPATEKVG